MRKNEFYKKLHTVETTITSIDFINKFINGKFKTAFYCASSNGKDRLCIYWNRSTIDVGDRVSLTGYIKENSEAFLVYQMLILKKNKNVENLERAIDGS